MLPVADIADREFWGSERIGAALRPALEKADAALGAQWPEARASQFARFWRDGDRKDYEGGVIARQHRLTYATLAALRTGSERYVDEVADGVILLCEQSTWCWAAHDHTFTRNGFVVPDVTDPCLDLGAGEVAAQLAWVDHLVGPALDDRAPGVRARIRHEVRRRVLDPFTHRRDWHWLGIDKPLSNWAAWIQGNILPAALALEDDVARRRHVVGLVARGIAAYWDSLPADGGIDEGYHYWWQGAARALEAQDLLDWYREQDPGCRPEAGAPVPPSDAAEIRARKIRQVVAFPHRMHLGGDWYVGVADSPARPIWTWPWNVVHSWARRVGDDDAARHAASYRRFPEILWDERVTLSRAVLALTDDEWAALPGDAAAPLVGEVFLPETQLALARTRPGSAEGLTVIVKGGHNGERHNHNDVGEVLVALDGVPVVVDAGKPTYVAGTFGEGRYEHWPMRSAWHNVPLVRGAEQSPGAEFAASGMTAGSQAHEWRAGLDIAGAYDAGGIRRWQREVVLDRAHQTVVVDDEWSTAEPDPGDVAAEPTSWSWVLAGDVELDDAAGHAAARHTAGRADDDVRELRIEWDPARATAALDVRRIDDDELAAVWGERLTRLSLTARKEFTRGTFRTFFRVV